MNCDVCDKEISGQEWHPLHIISNNTRKGKSYASEKGTTCSMQCAYQYSQHGGQHNESGSR